MIYIHHQCPLSWMRGFLWMNFSRSSNLMQKTKMLVIQKMTMTTKMMTMQSRMMMMQVTKISLPKKVMRKQILRTILKPMEKEQAIMRMMMTTMMMVMKMTTMMVMKKRTKMRKKRMKRFPSHLQRRGSESSIRSCVSLSRGRGFGLLVCVE